MRSQDDTRVGRWFREVRHSPNPQTRLICFPHAGGLASFFRPWGQLVPPGTELLAVRYPGREDRFLEPFAETMDELVEQIAGECVRLLDAPLAFFGHSMGASVAYEVALRLQAEHGAAVSALFVSGRSGPGREHIRPLSGASDHQLMKELTELGGTDAEAFEDAELRELVLPTIRADYRLVEAYTATKAGAALNAPVTAYYGTRDAEVSRDSVEAWAEVTDSGFRMLPFEGGHFFLLDHPRAIVDDIRSRLDPIARR
ncbi:thioesterase II family protein [Kitasatospora sp. NPDC058032]|uniref:thioesterase II family protein n=1 Tax=Kitasatospora sp. NPDC058032 TaxID=3346307 RepID=UPI0036DF6ADB